MTDQTYAHYLQWCADVRNALVTEHDLQPSEILLATVYGTYQDVNEATQRVKERMR